MLLLVLVVVVLLGDTVRRVICDRHDYFGVWIYLFETFIPSKAPTDR